MRHQCGVRGGRDLIVACPACGGTQYVAVAPGYVECTSGVVHQHLRFERPRPCGRRYHVGPPTSGSPAAVCGCGTFAIGLCGECGAGVCGDHSVLRTGRRVCAYHEREREEAAFKQRLADREKAGTAGKAEMDRFFAAMRAAGNPGLIKVWANDGVHLSHLKRLTKPMWDAWPLGYVSREESQDRTGLAVCPDRTWLAGASPQKKMGRWTAVPASNEDNLYSISLFYDWSITYTEAAELLNRYARSVGVRIA